MGFFELLCLVMFFFVMIPLASAVEVAGAAGDTLIDMIGAERFMVILVIIIVWTILSRKQKKRDEARIREGRDILINGDGTECKCGIQLTKNETLVEVLEEHAVRKREHFAHLHKFFIGDECYSIVGKCWGGDATHCFSIRLAVQRDDAFYDPMYREILETWGENKVFGKLVQTKVYGTTGGRRACYGYIDYRRNGRFGELLAKENVSSYTLLKTIIAEKGWKRADLEKNCKELLEQYRWEATYEALVLLYGRNKIFKISLSQDLKEYKVKFPFDFQELSYRFDSDHKTEMEFLQAVIDRISDIQDFTQAKGYDKKDLDEYFDVKGYDWSRRGEIFMLDGIKKDIENKKQQRAKERERIRRAEEEKQREARERMYTATSSTNKTE